MPANTIKSQPLGERFFDVGDEAAMHHAPHTAAGASRWRRPAPPMLPTAPASDTPTTPLPAALEARPARRPVLRGEAPAAPNSPPASLADVLFDQAMQHRAAPRFELHALPAVPLDTAAASAQQPPGRGPAHGMAEVHSPIEAPALSRAELVRVADQVERLLMQRDRFERERRGGL
jgi:hypothetical protein